MNVLVWLTEAPWAACVDAARAWSPADAEIVLLYVIDDDIAAIAHGGFAGLLGRSRPPSVIPARGSRSCRWRPRTSCWLRPRSDWPGLRARPRGMASPNVWS
jgi:hypothetical protein